MDIDEIKALMEAMTASDLSSMEVTKDGWTLRLTRGDGDGDAALAVRDTPPAPARRAAREAAPPPAEAWSAKAADGADLAVRSPLSGVVHFRPSPDAPPFVEIGGSVAAGDVLCLVEAMKMFNEIRADRAGTMEALLVSPGDEVDAGQPLLRIG